MNSAILNKNKQNKKVNFSNDTKILDGTSGEILLFAKLILGFLKFKNYEKIDTIEDVIKFTENINILELCIKDSFILIDNLLDKEMFKYFKNNYSTIKNNSMSTSIQLLTGKFYSKILYPDGKIEYVTHKFPLYYDNDVESLEIDWNHTYFDIRTNKYKNNDKVHVILKGSRDIKNVIGPNYITDITNFIKLLRNTQQFILYSSTENEF